MASLFDVSLRPSEPADQEISEAVLGTWKILRRVHRSQNVILRNLSIEGGDQACETFPANHRINFEFLHVLCSPDRTVPLCGHPVHGFVDGAIASTCDLRLSGFLDRASRFAANPCFISLKMVRRF